GHGTDAGRRRRLFAVAHVPEKLALGLDPTGGNRFSEKGHAPIHRKSPRWGCRGLFNVAREVTALRAISAWRPSEPGRSLSNSRNTRSRRPRSRPSTGSRSVHRLRRGSARGAAHTGASDPSPGRWLRSSTTELRPQPPRSMRVSSRFCPFREESVAPADSLE